MQTFAQSYTRPDIKTPGTSVEPKRSLPVLGCADHWAIGVGYSLTPSPFRTGCSNGPFALKDLPLPVELRRDRVRIGKQIRMYTDEGKVFEFPTR